jgi:hypothetical protein
MNAFDRAVDAGMVCRAPDEMLNDDRYMTTARVPLAGLMPLPEGWRTGKPTLTAAFHDARMSRWLDSLAIASNRTRQKNADGKVVTVPQEVEPLKLRFHGAGLLFFGESTVKSGKYRVFIDGEQVRHKVGKDKWADEFNASAERMGRNTHLTQVMATGLDETWHSLTIEPLLKAEEPQELRLESICIAGGKAAVELAD